MKYLKLFEEFQNDILNQHLSNDIEDVEEDEKIKLRLFNDEEKEIEDPETEEDLECTPIQTT